MSEDPNKSAEEYLAQDSYCKLLASDPFENVTRVMEEYAQIRVKEELDKKIKECIEEIEGMETQGMYYIIEILKNKIN